MESLIYSFIHHFCMIIVELFFSFDNFYSSSFTTFIPMEFQHGWENSRLLPQQLTSAFSTSIRQYSISQASSSRNQCQQCLCDLWMGTTHTLTECILQENGYQKFIFKFIFCFSSKKMVHLPSTGFVRFSWKLLFLAFKIYTKFLSFTFFDKPSHFSSGLSSDFLIHVH